MSIDFSRVLGPKEKAEEARRQRTAAIKADCRARIEAVLDARTVANLQGAALTSRLSKAERSTFEAAQDWIASTLQAGRQAIVSGKAPDWPTVPGDVEALADRF